MLKRLLSIFCPRQQEAAGLEAADLVHAGPRGVSVVLPERVVIQALAEADGRLRQQHIMEYTGWSASKVSRTLTDMEQQGYITRITVGREKVACLPNAVPESIRHR